MRVFVVALAVGFALAAAPTAGQEVPQTFPDQPPQPFPAGAKVAFINIQRIAAESAEGRAATAKVQTLNQQKVEELNKRNQQLQEAQQKLMQGQALLSDQARAQLEREIERMQVDIQRFTQDAQAEVQELQLDLQEEFQRRLFPVIQQLGEDMDLHMMFSQTDSGLVWANMGLDITDDVIERFDKAVAALDSGTAPAASVAPPAAPPSR